MRLAAVRRLAYEASNTGLLSPDLAAGIRRVKGAKRQGVRIGNWLTADQSRTLLDEPPSGSLRGKRDRAILALLIGCDFDEPKWLDSERKTSRSVRSTA